MEVPHIDSTSSKQVWHAEEETMDWSVEYATVSIALALLVILYFKMKWSGDLCHPVAATVVSLIINFKRLHDYLCDHHRRYKTYRISYPTFSCVCTTDPANVEHILRFNFANYVKGKFIHDINEDLFGDGIFSVDGEQWRQQRKLASFEFSTKMLKDSSSVAFRENVVKLSKILLEACGAKQAVEMQDGKYVVSDDILPDGFKVKKGDIINYVPYSMGRMTYLWGSDAEEFRPERWLQNGVFMPQSPFKFTAFQAGPRICLGKDFAYMQMKIFAAVLVRFFKFEAVEGKEVKYRPSLTLHMTEDGLNLRVKPRLDC